jgi:hypothetical protein
VLTPSLQYIGRDLQGLANFASRLTVCANTREKQIRAWRSSAFLSRRCKLNHTHSASEPIHPCALSFVHIQSIAASRSQKSAWQRKATRIDFRSLVWAEGQNQNRQLVHIYILLIRASFALGCIEFQNFKCNSNGSVAAWNASDDPSCSLSTPSLSFGESVQCCRERNTNRDVARSVGIPKTAVAAFFAGVGSMSQCRRRPEGRRQ